MGYNRTKAVDYARKFWDRPCDDGFFWLTDEKVYIAQKRVELSAPAAYGWVDRFIPQVDGHRASEIAAFIRPNKDGEEIPNWAGRWEIKKIHGWAGLADCAHYLSQCLEAGGANISERGVTELVANLQARSDTITLADRVPKANAQRIIDTRLFKPGDMIGYFNISEDGDFGRANSYTHSTMFVGKMDASGNADSKDPGRITCHSLSRFGHQYWDEEWWLHPTYTYTLIHFNSDDPMPSPDVSAGLPGWWSVEWAGRKEFYFFDKNGTVRNTNYQPKSARDAIRSPKDEGHWYDVTAVAVIWPKTGSVVYWYGIKDKAWLMIDGLRGEANKLF